jgi:hypothetical protein
MKTVILLGHRRVLWGTVMAACLLSGFILSANLLFRSAAVSHVTHVTQVSQSNPAPIPNPESRIPNPGYGPPAAGLATTAGTAQPRLAEAYGKLPLSFEINRGQTDSQVKFLSRGNGYSLFLTGNEAVLALKKPVQMAKGKRQMAKGKSEFQHSPFDAPSSLLQRPASFQFPVSNFQTPATDNEPRTTSAVLRMKLVGANPNPKIVGTDELPGKSNYFIGNDPKKWRTNVPNYAKVKYASVYPGVDLVYYGNQGKLEYDFVVQPGADPAAITLQLETGQSKIHNRKSKIDKNGDLVVGTDGGEVVFHKPVVYQPATYNELRTTNGGGRHFVEGRYVLRGDNRIAFQLADHDRRRPVIIDPVLAYSTYLGGSGLDGGSAIAVDASGNAYVTGGTTSSDFPTTQGAFQTTYGGDGPGDSGYAFVSKLNAAGSALLYSTYLGGSSDDGINGTGIAVDASGDAYVAGPTTSSDFPTTSGAFQRILHGYLNTFVSKLNATGSALVYSTYLGGSHQDFGAGIAVDASGNSFVTGSISSSDFPTTPGAFQVAGGGGFLTKLNPTGSALVYSTASIGGAAIALDSAGNAYVTGVAGPGFPTTPGAFQTTFGGDDLDAFISKLNAAGSTLLYSTYLGGSGTDLGRGIAVDASGNAYVAGIAGSNNFPTTPGAFQTTCGGGAFVTKLNASASALLYSTYLCGGGGFGMAVDASGNAYVSGGSGSADFPVTPGAFQTTFAGGDNDAFVVKISFVDAPGLALGPAELTFGPQPVHTTSASQRVALLDAGSFPLSITSIVASGDFAQTNKCGSAVQPGVPCTLSVTFKPSTTGTRSGAITITDDAPGSPHNLLLTGTAVGAAPLVTLTPSSLTFLLLRTVGTTSVPQTVKLTNVGSAELDITGITLGGDFAQSNNCPSTVASGASCLITVTFTPTWEGVRTASVSITDNAPDSPQTVPLTGRGTFLKWSPRSLNLGDQPVGTSSAAHTVTLTNAGPFPGRVLHRDRWGQPGRLCPDAEVASISGQAAPSK